MSLFYKCPIKALLNEHFDNPASSDFHISGSEQGKFVEVHHIPTGRSITLSPLDIEDTRLSHEYEVYIDTLDALRDLQFLAEEEQGEFTIDSTEKT